MAAAIVASLFLVQTPIVTFVTVFSLLAIDSKSFNSILAPLKVYPLNARSLSAHTCMSYCIVQLVNFGKKCKFIDYFACFVLDFFIPVNCLS